MRMRIGESAGVDSVCLSVHLFVWCLSGVFSACPFDVCLHLMSVRVSGVSVGRLVSVWCLSGRQVSLLASVWSSGVCLVVRCLCWSSGRLR